MPAKKKPPGASTARFAKVIAECGTPEVVLLWGEPSKAFLAAHEQDRVMTVLQTTTGHTKDYAVIGFQPRKNATYLLFPKPLTQFKDTRTIGINYDLIDSGPQTGAFVETPTLAVAKASDARLDKTADSKRERQAAASVAPPPPAPPPAPPVRKRRYEVTFRFLAEATVSERVESTSRAEARRLAEASIAAPDLSRAPVRRRLLRVKLVDRQS